MEEKLAGYKDSSQVEAWAKSSVASAIELGIVSGDGGKLRSKDNVTRAETAVMIRNLLEKAGLI